jgi:CDP-glucose 4,6-dehydratase
VGERQGSVEGVAVSAPFDKLRAGFWLDRPVFVTGGSGLLGGWLVKHLVDRGADVVCLIRDGVPQSQLLSGPYASRVKTVRGDVRDQALMERVLGEYEVNSVFHLAAQALVPIANRNPVSTFETNVQGTWALLEACRRSPMVKACVVASSDKAYGEAASLPYDETTPLNGVHPYDCSKSCADLIAQSYASAFKVPVAITRCGNFFGGGDLNWNRIVPGTVRSLIREERPVLRSDGSMVRDYLYVEDGALAYLTLAEALAEDPTLRGEAFNFSYEQPMSALEMVRRLTRVMGSALEPKILGEASHEIPEQWLSAQKARGVLGWKPAFEVADALVKTVEWYRTFFAAASAPAEVHP